MTASYRRGSSSEPAVLVVDRLSATYGFGRRSELVVRDVTFTVGRGQTMGVVGESGSGKSTLARAIAGRLPPASGSVSISGSDIYDASSRGRRGLRGAVQMVPQDPYGSLDPRMTIGRSLAEAVSPVSGRLPAGSTRVSELLQLVSIEPSAAGRLPHEFSGGQRQRVAIARALAAAPSVLVADEITSSLDASIQYEVLTILSRLQRELGFACVFITHNLGVAARMCDDVTVMRDGSVIEQGPVSILAAPGSAYTRELVASVPDPAGQFLEPVPAGRAASVTDRGAGDVGSMRDHHRKGPQA